MSWLKGLAGKAEDFLNQIDQNAAVVLQLPTENGDSGEALLTEVTWDGQERQGLTRPASQNGDTIDRPGSSSSDVLQSSRVKANQQSNNSSSMQSVRSSPNLTSFTPVGPITLKPKNDDALMEFLNRPPSSSPVVKKRIGTLVPEQSQNVVEFNKDVNKHINRPRTPLKYVENSNPPVPTEVRDECRSMPDENNLENSTSQNNGFPEVEIDKSISSSSTLSNKESEELRTENRLLQNELRSFNNEMSLLLQRSKAAEKECSALQQKISALEATNRQYSLSLESREEEALRTGLELQRSIRELSSAREEVAKLRSEIQSLKVESVDSESEALVECRRQLTEKAEETERVSADHKREMLVLNNAVHACKSERNSLAGRLEESQRLADESKKELNEWQEKFNSSRAQVGEVRAELDRYRARAQRILQDKEKLIAELRGETRGSPVDDLMDQELDQLRQERELVREEAAQVSARLQATRAELADAESRFEAYRDQAVETQSRLQESLQEERKQRQAAEEDCRTHSEGLHSVREELTRQRALVSAKLRDRDAELTKLRAQLTLRPPPSPPGDETEARLGALTQALVLKQASLETLTAERNALRLQFEKAEGRHREAMALLSQRQASSSVNDTDDAKARVPSFLEETPFDTGVARRVKRAYSNVDAISVRMGVFLRRYPLARILVLCYMVLLHVWVMIVLFTYSPEVHPKSTRASKGPY